jgi:hypothetical protein
VQVTGAGEEIRNIIISKTTSKRVGAPHPCPPGPVKHPQNFLLQVVSFKNVIKCGIIYTPRGYMPETFIIERTGLVAQLVFKTSSGRIKPSVAGSIPALSA